MTPALQLLPLSPFVCVAGQMVDSLAEISIISTDLGDVPVRQEAPGRVLLVRVLWLVAGRVICDGE